jgi:23S rRNA pseudouridine2605 synthase
MTKKTATKDNKQPEKQGGDKPAQHMDDGSAELQSERIAKRMARAGLCSRREAEKWILAGRVRVNNKLLETPAFTVTDRDKVEVDGKVIARKERTRLWLFHKPAGTVTTNQDPEGRKTIYDNLPEDLPRLVSVGRLDINTEGLLLMTNDGGLSRVLELPSTGWLRRYRVRVHGRVKQEELDELQNGIAVEGILYGSIEARIEHEQGTNAWLSVSLREGKNREIKKVFGHLGLEVTRLIRISFGPFQLGDQPAGTIREIRSRMLRDQLGEKLIEQSGADFEAPIINLAPEVARSASKAAEQGKKQSRTDGRKPREKQKRGTVRDDTLSRLTTSKGGKKTGRPGAAGDSAGRGKSRSGKPQRRKSR